MADRMVRVIVLDPTEPDKAFLREIPARLDVWQAVLGGYVEPLRLGADAIAYLGENAKLTGQPPNGAMNRVIAVANPGLHGDDFVAGTAMLFGYLDQDGLNDGLEHDASDEVFDLVLRAGLEVVDETGVAGQSDRPAAD